MASSTWLGSIMDTSVTGAVSPNSDCILTTIAAAAAGTTVIVLVAMDGNRTIVQVLDSAGNSYTEVGTAATTGTTVNDSKCQIFQCTLTNALALGQTITVNTSGAAGGGVYTTAYCNDGFGATPNFVTDGFTGASGAPAGQLASSGLGHSYAVHMQHSEGAAAYTEAGGWTTEESGLVCTTKGWQAGLAYILLPIYEPPTLGYAPTTGLSTVWALKIVSIDQGSVTADQDMLLTVGVT